MITRQIILDANVFKIIYEDLINLNEGDGSTILNCILDRDIIVVDDRNVILTQWKNSCCGEEDEFFLQWVATAFIEDKLRQGEVTKDTSIKRHLINELGLPRDDLIYLILAIGASAFLVVSEDIDLHEPKAKKRDSKHKRKIILDRGGSISKYLKRKHDILVCCIEHANSLLQI